MSYTAREYTDEEYKTYVKVKRALMLEDARDYARDYLENTLERELGLADVTEEQFESIDFGDMVDEFERRTDYFDPTADVWYDIVQSYFEDSDFFSKEDED